jgi:hypothetical protein
MKRRIAAVAAAVSLVAVAGITTASASSAPLGPGDHVGKCHLLGNGNYIYIEPSAASYVVAGHRTRNDGDVFPTFRFQQNKKSSEVTIEGTADPDLLAWVDDQCRGPKPGGNEVGEGPTISEAPDELPN